MRVAPAPCETFAAANRAPRRVARVASAIVLRARVPPHGRAVLHVAPNPASDRIQVSGWATVSGEVLVRLCNLSGHCVLEQHTTDTALILETGALPGGVYLLYALDTRTQAQSAVQKVVLLR